MSDVEVLRMVVFKLEDTRRRLGQLAPKVASPRIRAQVNRIIANLKEQESLLRIGDTDDAPGTLAVGCD